MYLKCIYSFKIKKILLKLNYIPISGNIMIKHIIYNIYIMNLSLILFIIGIWVLY